MKIFPITILFLLFSRLVLPQYSKNDEQLVKTTFSKEFNREIINRYLKSEIKENVNAALLTISQSEDTSWIPQITQLDFNIFHKEICFALGELGNSSQSSTYLIEKLRLFSGNPDISHQILEAIGQTGDKNNYLYITKGYFKSDKNRFVGISIALFNFFRRNIFDNDLNNKIIKNELSSSNISSRKFFEAAFALYRIGGNDFGNDDVIKYILDFFSSKEKLDVKEHELSSIYYLLSYFGKIKYFPSNFGLLQKIISSPIYNIKVAAAQSLCYYNFKDVHQLSVYLRLLDDNNITISRQESISIKNINIETGLKEVLRKLILRKIVSGKISNNSKGELFISYLKLFPQSFSEISSNFRNKINVKYLIEGCVNFDSSEIALNFLSKKYFSTSEKIKLTSLTSLLKFLDNFPGNDKIKAVIFNSLSSNSAALISTAADGVDSNFITSNQSTLVKVISSQCLKLKNNSEYLESLMSLSDLSLKIDSSFGTNILKKLSLSNDYSIKKFAYKKLGRSTIALRRDISDFDKLWELAFRYKRAEIKTNKGDFLLEFLPQFSPMTVGNFCYLTIRKIIINNRFHRVVPGFVIQGGDPEETGWGGPGYEINSELSPLTFNAGKVGMASAGKDTEGSQWFVTTGYFPHLDGRYTIFAKVKSGIDTVQNIDQDDKVSTIILFR